ncbi:MAG: exonuclease subunit SbcD [Bacteroidales bacterium]|nr:exonuclease subunit SbcD [Bacteroidales bacterium]
MKIIHTADWHLGDRLGRLDRTADLRKGVERVAEYCEEHQVELLLVAGDLFYERIPLPEMADALRHIHRVFKPFFARGGTILAITGNHDDDAKIDLVRAGSFLAAPTPNGTVFDRGRMYLQNGLTFGRFHSAAGEQVQLVLVPYPRAVRFGLEDSYRTREEEHRLLQNHLTEWSAQIFRRPEFDISLPTILMAHLHVRGANLQRTLFRVSEADDVLIDPAILKSGWSYVALGHIHAAQAIDDVPTLQYPGPLDRLDFGERHDERGVLLLDLGRTGLQNDPVRLPLAATPMWDLTLTDPDSELPRLPEQYPQRESAIVRVTVDSRQSTVSRDEIARKLRKTFPRLHQITWSDDATSSQSHTLTADPTDTQRTPAASVRAYLEARLAGDPDRGAILALAEHYIATLEMPV